MDIRYWLSNSKENKMVKNILLIRHCQASPDSPTNRDFDRPLSDHGKKQAELLGQHLHNLPDQLDAIYVSPAIRTMQTTKGILNQLAYKPRLMDAEEVYEATDNVLKAMIPRFDPNFNRIAMIGHNPAISLLFNHLTSDLRTFSPGTSAEIIFEVNEWNAISKNSGSVRDFFVP